LIELTRERGSSSRPTIFTVLVLAADNRAGVGVTVELTLAHGTTAEQENEHVKRKVEAHQSVELERKTSEPLAK
jgi:hypothetical protein